MVSGSKQNSRIKKGPKKREKLVIAKDPKQAAIAIAAICLFFLNSIYMVVKYVQSQFPQPATTQAVSSTNSRTNPDGTQNLDQTLKTTTTETTTNENSMQNGATQNMASQPLPSSSSPIMPILLVLLVLTAITFAVRYLSKKDLSSFLGKSTTQNDIGKNLNKKGKLVFAKDKKQAIIAMVVVSIFILNSIYSLIKYFQSQNPIQMTANNSSVQPMNPEDLKQPSNPQDLAQMQGGNNPTGQNVGVGDNNFPPQGGSATTQTVAGGQSSGDEIEIIPKRQMQRQSGKMVLISVANSGRSNPFLPAAENPVPSASVPFLPPPPDSISSNTDAGKVMSTTISGILYDKYSPSAIINIEGTDYLVKRGDVLNHYRILSISKTQVLVQLGKNVYKAGVGELLSQTDLNYNTIANLNKKFGGNTVSINVKKKNY